MDREPDRGVDRRTFLAGALVAVGAWACGGGGESAAPGTTTGPSTTNTSAGRDGGGPARFVASGPTTRPRVALTFHADGDVGLAQQVLDVLGARRVPMTAFVVGSWLDANPTWARRLTDAGHELANHTYTHPTFESLSPAAMLGEVTRCRDVLARLTGSGGRWFRPSGTSDGTSTPSAACLEAARAAGYATVLGFDVDPFDYQDPGAATVAQRTFAAVRPGSVVSLHFGHPGTIAALPAILDGLTARSLTPVTVSQLLA